MLENPGFRPLWPVILFLPLFLVGLGYLLDWVRHRLSAERGYRHT
jgi:hypothetical protein